MSDQNPKNGIPTDPSVPDSRVTRFEVIDASGRAYVAHDISVDLSTQDDGRTLKVFIRNRSGATDGAAAQKTYQADNHKRYTLDEIMLMRRVCISKTNLGSYAMFDVFTDDPFAKFQPDKVTEAALNLEISNCRMGIGPEDLIAMDMKTLCRDTFKFMTGVMNIGATIDQPERFGLSSYHDVQRQYGLPNTWEARKKMDGIIREIYYETISSGGSWPEVTPSS